MDKTERFLDVLRYFLSGFHIRPKGVKKPYNPIIGEYFRCQWKFEDNTESFYIGEQVSHHPPISCFVYSSPENNLLISGSLRPKSKFLGNSACTIMNGTSKINFTNLPGEDYVVGNPNIYVRGLLIGTMLLELGDKVTLTCEKSDLCAEIEFKVKGFFTGTYNAISVKVKSISLGETLYKLTGKWSDKIFIQNIAKGTEKELFLDTNILESSSKIVSPNDEQDLSESRKLWEKVTKAMLSRNLDLATQEKSVIEDEQRHLAKLRDDDGLEWRPKFFICDKSNDEWNFIDSHLLTENNETAKHKLKELLSRHTFNHK